MQRKLRLFLIVSLLPVLLFADQFAVIFSGGWTPGSNYDRYYNNTLRMWDLAVNTLNYNVDNVYVLFADGTDPGVDRPGGVSSDWSTIINAGGHIGSAGRDDLQNTLSDIGNRMTDSEDSFFFWSFDHGSPGALCGWDQELIQDDEFALWVDDNIVDKNPVTEAYVFGQCFAGAMVDDLGITADDTHRFATWAATADEVSYGDGFVDAFADGIESGLTMTHALGQYAIDHDPFLGRETPGMIGGNFDLMASEVPEPSVCATLILGLMLMTTRMRNGKRRK